MLIVHGVPLALALHDLLIDDTEDGNEYLRDDRPRLAAWSGIDLMAVDSAWLNDRSNTAPHSKRCAATRPNGGLRMTSRL